MSRPCATSVGSVRSRACYDRCATIKQQHTLTCSGDLDRKTLHAHARRDPKGVVILDVPSVSTNLHCLIARVFRCHCRCNMRLVAITLALCALDGNKRCRGPSHTSAKGLVEAGVGQFCWVDPHGPGFRNVYALCRQTSSAEIATAPYGEAARIGQSSGPH
jgi:hypothetical protein